MRLLLMYDMPMQTERAKRDYRNLRRFLMQEGYAPVQYSVFSRIVVDERNARAAIARLRKSAPEGGLIQVLRISEQSYANMETIAGMPPESSMLQTNDEVTFL